MKIVKSRSSKLYTIGSTTSIKSVTSSGVTYFKPIKKVRTYKDVEEFKKEIDIDEHIIEFDDLVMRYGTDLSKGLTQEKADALLTLNGPNCLVPTATKSKWIALLRFLFGGFNVIIWIGGVLSFIEFGIVHSEKDPHLDSVYLGVVLFVVALITGFFGYYQEYTHFAISEGFSKMVPKFATVMRNGQKHVIPSEELVEGDLVEIQSGDMVPADMRIIEAVNMKVNNSAITGESQAVPRGPECSDINPLETVNLVFYGTSVIEGSGMGIVIRCGDHTVLGHIAGLTSSITKDETLLRKELNFFVKIISAIALTIGTTLFILSMVSGYTFFESFALLISVAVGNVPEGLPVAFTVCMSLTAKRMAKKNCLIKKFEIIETLGACNVICSDKTGTLTENVMTASHLYYDGVEYDVLTDQDSINTDSEAYQALCNVAMLCSRATFVETKVTECDIPEDVSRKGKKKRVKTTSSSPIGDEDVVRINGDASEKAILYLMQKLFKNVKSRRSMYPKVCEIPFTSAKKYQVSIHQLEKGNCLLVMKGAPETVLEHCSTILREGETLPVTSQTIKPIKRSIMNMGRRGERVLAFADLNLPQKYHSGYGFDSDEINFPLAELRFLGLISLIDPPRHSVSEAVEKCRSAGIRVIMVTGDHPITAAAVARKVGIISSGVQSSFDLDIWREDSRYTMDPQSAECNAAVFTGTDLKNMSQAELEYVLRKHQEIVFARTSPQQKLKIVEALQRLKLIVAVTGDGVNDSPALKKADIGIAMGITGSEVSKEAADMILLDDNFASIVTGIEEGRLIFDNLKKSISYELTSNVPEMIPFIFLMALNIPQALSIMAILVIDVGTDLWAAVSLAYESAELDIMHRRPRDPKKDKLINRRLIATSYFQIGVIQTCAAYTCYFYVMAQYGFFWHRLMGIRSKWESKDVNDLVDSYGQEWTYEQRQILTRKCISAFFLAIVVTQIADLLRCKTRRLSLFKQGMTNHVLNAGLMFEVFLAGIVVYCPGINRVFQFEPIHLSSIAPAVPYALIIVFYDEFRKYMIRSRPHGFFYNETYY